MSIREAFEKAAIKKPEFNKVIEAADEVTKERLEHERHMADVKKQIRVDSNKAKRLWRWRVQFDKYTSVSGIAWAEDKAEVYCILDNRYDGNFFVEEIDCSENFIEIARCDG